MGGWLPNNPRFPTKHRWLREVDANLRRNEPLWRKTGDGHGTTLLVTEAGLLAVGIEPLVVKTAAAIAVKSAAAAAHDVEAANLARILSSSAQAATHAPAYFRAEGCSTSTQRLRKSAIH